MKKIFLCLAVVTGLTANAQLFEVVKTQQVETGARTEAYHPRFMPDGKSLLVSSENYQGLGLVSLETKQYTHLTDMDGAGYYPAISDDGSTIITRNINYEAQNMSLYKIDVKKRSLTVLEKDIEHINRVDMFNGNLTYALQGRTYKKSVSKMITPIARPKTVLVTEEDLKVVVYIDGARSVIDPLSTEECDAQYCWSSLSPDQSKVCFVSGANAYVCNLDGSNLVNLGELRAPVWQSDSVVVGMLDEDDGHVFTASEIIAVTVDGAKRQQLTTKSSEIKMFPSVSADGSQVAYNTIDGKIYLMTIKKK